MSYERTKQSLDIIYWEGSPVQSSPVQCSTGCMVQSQLGQTFLPPRPALTSLNATKSSQFPQPTSTPSSSSGSFHPDIWPPSPGRVGIISLSCSLSPHQNRLSINGDISDTIYFTMKISIHYLRSTVLRFGKYEPTMCIQCLVCREERERGRVR